MTKYKQLMLMVPGVRKTENRMDFYQSLSVQGIYQTVCVAEKIKEDLCDNPEFIFSGTALYMRQTAEIMHQTFSSSELVFRDNLYAANEKNLLYFLKHLDDIFDCLLVISEWQSIQKLFIQLTGENIELNPSGCVCIQWPAHQAWKIIDDKKGKLIQIWLP